MEQTAIDKKDATLEEKLYAWRTKHFSNFSTWIPREYELNKTYGDDKVAFSPYLTALREEVRQDTLRKIGEI